MAQNKGGGKRKGGQRTVSDYKRSIEERAKNTERRRKELDARGGKNRPSSAS